MRKNVRYFSQSPVATEQIENEIGYDLRFMSHLIINGNLTMLSDFVTGLFFAYDKHVLLYYMGLLLGGLNEGFLWGD